MTVRKPEPKNAVKLIRDAFTQSTGTAEGLSVKQAYDLLAHLEGFKNWAHAKATLDRALATVTTSPCVKPKIGFTEDDVKGWPVYLVFSGYNDTSYDEVQFVLPRGATFENRRNPRNDWTPFNEDGAVELPDVFSGIADTTEVDAKRLSGFVVKEIYATVPRAERYGLPMFASEYAAHQWALEDLGWNYLAAGADVAKGKQRASAVSVDFSDTGDDTGAKYWMEVAIEPKLAEELDAKLKVLYEQAALEVDPNEWVGIDSDLVYTGSNPKTQHMLGLGLVFADCDGKTLGELDEALQFAIPREFGMPCEDFLRERLNSGLLSVNRAYADMTAKELRAHFEAHLDAYKD